MWWPFRRRVDPSIAALAEKQFNATFGAAPEASPVPRWLIALFVLMLIGAAGAGWYAFLRPENPMVIARRLMESGQLQAARAALRDIVAANPASVDAHFRLGSQHLRLGDPVAGSKELRIARDMGMAPAQVSPLLAQAYLGQQLYKELLEEFPTGGLPPPEAANLLTLRAMAQLALDDKPGATKSVELAAELAPESVDVAIAAARVAYARNDREAADREIDRALDLNPLSGEALSLRGLIATDRGDTAKALEAYDAAMVADPSLLNTRLNRANLEVNLGLDAQAKLDVDFILADQPENATALYLRGVLLARAKDFRGALTVLQRIDPLLAEFPRGLFILALVKSNLGQGAQAMEAATKYVARNPADLDGVKLLTQMYLAAGQVDKAIELLSNTTAQGRADADILYSLGQILIRTGQKQIAVQRLEQALALAPNNKDISALLAKTRAQTAGAESQAVAPVRPDPGTVTEAAVATSLTLGDLAVAKAQLEALRQVQGFTERVGILTGMIALAELDLTSATAVFKDVVRTYPDSTMARVNLAKIAALQNHVDDAEQILGETLTLDPRNRLAATTLAGILLANGLASRAIAVLESAHDAAPNDIELTSFLLDAYSANGQAPRAITLMRALPQEQANALPMMAVRARAQEASGRPTEARETYSRILTVNPTDKLVRLRLVELTLAAKDTRGAQQLLRDGLRIAPGDTDMMAAIIRTEVKTSGVEAALLVATELEGDPANQPAARTLRGDVYLLAGRLTEAAEAYAAQLAVAPSSDLVLRAAGALYAARQVAPAREVLQTWIATHPNDNAAVLSVAGLDLEEGKIAEAEPLLVGVLQRQPNNPVALSNMAWIFQVRGDPQAREFAQKAYFLAPGPATAASLGWVLTTTGDPVRGLVLLTEAARQIPNDAALQYHLAYAYAASGEKAKAETALRGLLAAFPNFPDRPAAVRLLSTVVDQK